MNFRDVHRRPIAHPPIDRCSRPCSIAGLHPHSCKTEGIAPKPTIGSPAAHQLRHRRPRGAHRCQCGELIASLRSVRQSAVEIEPQRTSIRFTRRVGHCFVSRVSLR
jgi:hypothetical protein